MELDNPDRDLDNLDSMSRSNVVVDRDETMDPSDPRYLRELAAKLGERVKTLTQDSNEVTRYEDLADAIEFVLPFFVSDLGRVVVNPDRSAIASRYINAIGKLVDIQKHKSNVEFKDELEVNSPKFQQAFSWFLDLVFVIISREVDTSTRNILFQEFSDRFQGWEDKLDKVFKKSVSSKSLASLTNPLFDKELQTEFETIRGGQSNLLEEVDAE